MNICAIHYNLNASGEICGLQFHFYNGMSSEKLQTDEQPPKSKWKVAEFDPSDQIQQIELCMTKG